MKPTDLFIGTWELVPELSLYEWGPLPVTCTYEITQNEVGVQVHMRYAMEHAAPEQVVSYGGPVDGSRRALLPGRGAAAPDGFSLTRVDARTLDSSAFRGQELLAYGRRVASHDGQLMAIVQQGQRPDGSPFRNFQVYRSATV